MKKEKNTKAQEVKKTNLVEGINNLIEEKAEKVEKSKKALKVVGKEKEATEKASEKKVKKTKKEKLVDKAVVLQNGHPCVGAEQEVYPHREHDEHHAKALFAGGQAAHEVRHRVAERKAHHGREKRQPE